MKAVLLIRGTLQETEETIFNVGADGTLIPTKHTVSVLSFPELWEKAAPMPQAVNPRDPREQIWLVNMPDEVTLATGPFRVIDMAVIKETFMRWTGTPAPDAWDECIGLTVQ